MALVHLLSTAPQYDARLGKGSDELRRLRDAARTDRFGVHSLTDDPDGADLLLFVDAARPDLLDIRTHPLRRSRIEDAFVVHHGDRIYPFVPGVFTCAEAATHSPSRSRTGSYLTVMENPLVEPEAGAVQPRWLFSFVGRTDSAPVRARLMEISDQRGLLVDTSRGALPPSQYVRSLHDSRFVLCPRGFGSSSYRLFEAMKAGRAPVILSDTWVPPLGPAWQEFSLVIREADAASVPRLLEARVEDSLRMGTAARCAWEEWFGPAVVFHRTVEWCLQLRAGRRLPERWAAPLASAARMHPRYFAARLQRSLRRTAT